MSGLAALLAGHRPGGVYRWHAAFDVQDVRHTVEHAEWSFAYVDGWTHSSKAALLVATGEALGFPGHYGANLDALADCLRDVDQPTVLLWDGWGPLAREDADAFAVLCEIFAERAEEEPAFAVLLRGEGPEVSAPALDL